jgi:hypothetical protein
MTEEPTIIRPLHAPRRWKLLLLLLGIFLCGGVVGGAVSRLIVRNQMLSTMRNPGEVPNRIVPMVIHSLDLTGERARQVEALIRNHYRQMEVLRAQTYPQQIAEFESMCTAINKHLDESQQHTWAELTAVMRERYLPVAPVRIPPSDFLFSTFDANHDESLDESEVPPRMWRHLRNADTDSDGVVSRPEFESARGESQQ